jgi:O-antigen/teichoic acid export membrane protein
MHAFASTATPSVMNDNDIAAGNETIRKQVRGSGLLLSGTLFSIAINLFSQLLAVRLLATNEFGAWAYALSIVTLCQVVVRLGLNDAVPRFVPIYHEHRDYQRMFGTIVLAFGTVLASGFVIVGALRAFPQILHLLTNGKGPVSLLLVAVFIVPIDAVDGMLMGLFASFSSPYAICARKHVVGPVLKLVAVLILLVFGRSAMVLAYGYVIGLAAGVLVFTAVLIRQLRRKGVLACWPRHIKVPVREIFSFSLPMMTTDLVLLANQSLPVLLLGYLYDLKMVAMYRVVLPAAGINMLVMTAFTSLYMPTASRLLARDDRAGINRLYWHTAAWMTVLSFPIFAATCCFARPLTVALYGARYAESSAVLALLSFGYYFNVVLGFNGLTLKVLGKVRYVVLINIAATVSNLAFSFLLIPRYGALGAAIAAAGSMVLHNLLKQAGLRMASGVSLFAREYSWFYGTVVASALILFIVPVFAPNNVFVLVVASAVVSLTLLRCLRRELKIGDTFPEGLRIPILGRYLA